MEDTGVHFRNGVDLGRLTGTVDAVKSDPSLARFAFRAKNRWIDGARSRTEIRGFFGTGKEHVRSDPFLFEGDEPPVLLGHDAGANAVEALLQALASCLVGGRLPRLRPGDPDRGARPRSGKNA